MARATKATTTQRSAAAAPKKIGRPVGSKNRVPASPKANAAAAPKKVAARGASAAPAPVRMNKAELEAKVVKLERSLARARTQTAELKQALKAAQEPVETTKAPSAKASSKGAGTDTGTTPPRRRRRSKAEIAAAEEAQDSEAAQSEE